MNYMKEVAKLLELELGEEFKLKDNKDNTNGGYFNTHFALTENGLKNIGDKIIYQNLLECILKGRYDIVKIPKAVLTDEEKEYLSTVLKPFRNEIDYIYKCSTYRGEKEYIAISFKKITRDMFFPEYPIGTMYKGMILNKEYSLDDLRL